MTDRALAFGIRQKENQETGSLPASVRRPGEDSNERLPRIPASVTVVQVAEAGAEVALVVLVEAVEEVGGDRMIRRLEFFDDLLQQGRRGRAVDESGQQAGAVRGDNQAQSVRDGVTFEQEPARATDQVRPVKQQNLITV